MDRTTHQPPSFVERSSANTKKPADLADGGLIEDGFAYERAAGFFAEVSRICSAICCGTCSKVCGSIE